VKTTVDANATTVEDQAAKVRRSITNALGQLTRLDEPTSTGLGSVTAPTQPTVYTYDVLNNLLTVTQAGSGTEQCGSSSGNCTQTRSFFYSSLSRLTSATNPESGTISYGYDPNGNLTRKTDARGVQTDYVYDELNRIKNRNYSTTGGTPANYQASPNVTYAYRTAAPAVGALASVSTGTGANTSTTEYVSFDILGRVTRSKQTTDGVVYGDDTNPMTNTYPMTYTYNLSGALIEQQYPSGRKVKNELDASGDLALVESKKNPSNAYWTYAGRFAYNAAGAVTSMQMGNGRWESTQFNSRLQPTQIALGKTESATNLLDLDYSYGTTQNSGNVLSQTINVQNVGVAAGFAAVQNYTYDSLNRIQIASETLTPTTGTAESWTQEFRYDRYGNRTFHEPTTTTLPKECNGNTEVCAAIRPVVNPSASTSNNRLIGYTFDSAGSTTRDAENRKFTYDAENKQTRVETVSGQTVTGAIGEYWYDGEGRRIKKQAYENNVLTEETIFVYDALGKLIGEYSNQIASPTEAKVAYLTNDHLGSPRINTEINGNVAARHDYHPFGEEIASSKRVTGVGYAGDPVRKQFTGYERDGETDLDYAKARYYAQVHGRFTTTDPLQASAKPASPQTWNRFVYVMNNPLNYSDPDGQCSVPTGLQKGQVGICVEAFIKTRRLPGLPPTSMGKGDNRDFSGTDETLTAKSRTHIIITPQPETGNHYVDQTTLAGVSRVSLDFVFGPFVGDRNPEYSADGSVVASLTNMVTTEGSLAFTLNVTALNGLPSLPGSPNDPIDYSVNFTVDANNAVGLAAGGRRDGYPSFAIYSYEYVNEKLVTTEIYKDNEGKLRDLADPMERPIPEVKPRKVS